MPTELIWWIFSIIGMASVILTITLTAACLTAFTLTRFEQRFGKTRRDD